MKISIPAGADPHHMYLAWRMATDLMDEYSLRPNQPGGWKFFFDHAPLRAGRCNRFEKLITLSGPVIMYWPMDEIRDTILHEIAHALTLDAHGPAWKAMCRRIGARPEVYYPEELRPPSKFVGTCPNGHTVFRQQQPRSVQQSCASCSPEWDKRYPITWKKNPEALT
jgi:SprT protein